MVDSDEVSEPDPVPILEDCPNCSTTIDMTGVPAFSDVLCPACGHSIKARAMFNHFQILSLLGEGGMGAVYRAVDVNLDREVALKVLKISLSENPDECEKLAREARTTAQINHPHVIKIFDFGDSRGQFYIAMELITGGSLDDLMHRLGVVPENTVLQVGIQVAEGLKAAMEKGLIHRDIKPANILFADPETAKLVDFGLAMVMSEAALSQGEIWGTPYYIAPEKLDELPEDFRSDMYSLGGTLFHALAGRPPYEAENASLVALKQLKSRPVSLQSFAPDVSNETAYVINRMMAKSPDKRYGSYDELIEHLRFALEKNRERETNPGESRERPVAGSKYAYSDLLTLVLPTLILLGILALGYVYFFTKILKPQEGSSLRQPPLELRPVKPIRPIRPAGFGHFDRSVNPAALAVRAADAVGVFPHHARSLGDVEEKVGLILVDGPLELAGHGDDFFSIVFLSDVFEQAVGLRVFVTDHIQLLGIRLRGMPDLELVVAVSQRPTEHHGVKVALVDVVFQKHSPLVEFHLHLDSKLFETVLRECRDVAADFVPVVCDERKRKTLAVFL